MEKLLFNPKPLSKPEIVFLKRLNKRRPDFQISTMDRIVRESMAAEKEQAEKEATNTNPDYIYDWITKQ